MYGCGFDVSVIESSVRPWNAPSKAITAGRRVYEARELDRVLDRLGAGVEEGRLGGAGERRALEQPLGERDVDLVRDDREVGVA